MRVTINIKQFVSVELLAGCSLASNWAQAAENTICYNCPPEWADWATQLQAIEKATGIQVP